MQNVAYYPINIVAGDDFSLRFNWKIKDCSTGILTGVDITGATVEAKLLDNTNAELIVFTGVVSDATEGGVTISLTDTQSATLNGLITTKPVETIGRYYVRLILASGEKVTILRGKASLTNVEGV